MIGFFLNLKVISLNEYLMIMRLKLYVYNSFDNRSNHNVHLKKNKHKKDFKFVYNFI